MKIIQDLGINSTVFVQFVVFLLAYLALTRLVFQPYLKAHHERQRRTEGEEALAERLLLESQDIHKEYEGKAQVARQEFKKAFDDAKGEALKEYDRIIATARDESHQKVQAAKKEIDLEVEKSRSLLSKEVPSLSGAIVSKLIGKDLH